MLKRTAQPCAWLRTYRGKQRTRREQTSTKLIQFFSSNQFSLYIVDFVFAKAFQLIPLYLFHENYEEI